MKYEEARNEANRLVRKAMYEYERSTAINMKKESKMFWKFIQSKTKTKENIPCIIDEKGFIVSMDILKFVASAMDIFLTV
jgi:cytochrome b involved in lipid metabolism